jgi:Flp pilus assembly protein TadB
MIQDIVPPKPEVDDAPPPRAQIAELVNDVRNLAEAEWDYAKARLVYSGGVVRKAGLYALLSILALCGASIAMVLGILLIVASYFGPWVATIAVVAAFSLAAFVLAISARKTARNLSFAQDESDD